MSHYSGTMLGLDAEGENKLLAEQLLKCIGADPAGKAMYEEIGKLDSSYSPDVCGQLEEDDLLGISSSVEEKYSEYMEKFDDYIPGFYDEEDDEDEEESKPRADADSRLDDFCLLVKQLFGNACVYFAHEEGNSSDDSYYRYEAVLDPSRGKKRVVNCYYSFDGGPEKEEGTEYSEYPLNAKKYKSRVIDSLIRKAESYKFDELAEKLRVYKSGPDRL